LRLRQILIQPGDSPEKEQVQITLGRIQREMLIDLLERLRGNPAVIEINHERL
jgi:hypothetical protein